MAILILLISFVYSIDVDYIKANKNSGNFAQVPMNHLIWGKIQALEPVFFFEGQLKGKGFIEPVANIFINKIRETGVNIYVDYFTIAKTIFYNNTDGYEICNFSRQSFKAYKGLKEKLNKNIQPIINKFMVLSVPFNIVSPIGTFAILTDRLKDIEHYKFSGTDVYNIKSILDDETLYTVQITGSMDNAISKYIYEDSSYNNLIIKRKYKKRVYDFVASNSFQLTLMLNGKRMDWVEMTLHGDYHFKLFGLKKDKMTFLNFSHIHPKLLTKEDLLLTYAHCVSKKLDELKKYILIINENAKKIRGNSEFWTQVLKNYAKDLNISYIPPDQFFYTRESIKRKKELEGGYFD